MCGCLGHDHSHDHDHSENENIYGVFLHILADALGSVGVIISSIFVKYYDIYIADAICSFIISLLILGSVVPLIQMSSKTLTLGVGKPKKLETCEKVLKGISEVQEYRVKTFEVAQGQYVYQIIAFSNSI